MLPRSYPEYLKRYLALFQEMVKVISKLLCVC